MTRTITLGEITHGFVPDSFVLTRCLMMVTLASPLTRTDPVTCMECVAGSAWTNGEAWTSYFQRYQQREKGPTR